MFESDIYTQRRILLKKQIKSGLILFLGNDESPMNYADNPYPFRQDSSFLYFWGLDAPGLAATIDLEDDKEVIYGDDLTINDIVWMGPQPSINEKCQRVGVSLTAPIRKFGDELKKASKLGKTIHFLPQYRADNILKLASILDIEPSEINHAVSNEFIKVVVSQRQIKSLEEIEQIELALEISNEMHMMAMKMSKPGMVEREIVGSIEGIALSKGGYLAFPVIFSIHGEILHNHYHGNLMQAGNIVVNDSGATSSMHYASDITRTIPIGGKFTERQKEIYQLVLDTQEKAIAAVKPGMRFKDIHVLACQSLAIGLKELGFMRGNVDEAVAAGAHALFFQCGLGHMMGLDVHDMESLGEQFVGYEKEVPRSNQFGLRSLRLAKTLHPGFVITIEPGIYFIPELIDRWKYENKFAEYINYDKVEKYENFGGIRIEDDILVTQNGNRVLGKSIPKTIEEVEELASG